MPGANNKLIRTTARYAKHKLAGVGHRGKAAPPKSRRGGQNDYQMRMIRDSESIEDVNDSQHTVETAPNGLDCQLLRGLTTIVAHGKTSATRLVMLRCINCQCIGMLDRVPCLRIDANRHNRRAILRPNLRIELRRKPFARINA